MNTKQPLLSECHARAVVLGIGRPLFAALVTGWLSLAACSSSESERSEAPAPAETTREEISDVIYRPGATDEGLLTLLDARPVDAVMSQPLITAPAEGATLTAPATFTVQPRATARRARPPSTRTGRRAFSWGELLTLERSASAHGAAMNGDAYFLVFSASDDPKVLRVFGQDTSYLPTDDEWQRLLGAHGSVTLTVTRAIFEQGRLTADGGPFVSEPLHFSATQ